MSTSSGQTADLRIRKLNLTAPPVLVGPPTPSFLQTEIIDRGVNLKDMCGEAGDGSFSWLFHFDMAAHTLTTGGAPPSADPFGVGYCFTRGRIDQADVAPVTIAMSENPDGTFSSDLIPKLNVPIYVHGSATNIVLLPLTNSRIRNVTLSLDHNCIGSFNPDGVLSPNGPGCLDQNPTGCQRWHTGGSLAGYITLEEADSVMIADLGKSLCVLLTRGASVDASKQHCARDGLGKIVAMGDYCSQTGAPGGCADSAWLAATFAASAAKLNDGSADPACNGSGVVTADAGGAGPGDASELGEAGSDGEAAVADAVGP
jgi:hypothetical protein